MEGVIKLGKQILKISIGQILLILIVIIAVVWGISVVKKNANPTEIENVVTSETDSSTETKNEAFEDTTVANTNFNSVFSNDENVLTEALDEDKIVYVTSVKDNEDETYTLSGIIYKKYIITASEFRYALDDGEITINGDVYTIHDTDEENCYDLYLDGSDVVVYSIKQSSDRNYYLEAQTELSDCWKLTEDTCKVIVGKDVKVEESYGEEFTVEEIFGNMENSVPEDTTHPDSSRTFRFEFRNEECTKIEDVLTSV